MRYRSVDALRGISALVVLLHHCMLTFDFSDAAPGSLSWALQWTPLRLLVDGPGAVLIFFAVSGFALAASLDGRTRGGGRLDYLKYAIGRLLRIYPPFALAVLASAALFVLIKPRPIDDLSDWFNNESWAYPVTWRLIIGHLLMLDRHEDMTLLNPMWALIHILRISIAFPLIFLPLRARPLATLLVLAAISGGANYALSNAPLSDLERTVCGTLQYVIVFAIGAEIFLARALVGAAMRAGRGAVALAVFAAGLALFWPPRDAPVFGVWIPGLAAALLLAFVVGSPAASKALSGGLLAWLGAISYSLYLVHLPVVLSVFHLGWGYAPAPMLVCAAIAGAFAAAELMHRFVEKPFIALSRFEQSRTQPS